MVARNLENLLMDLDEGGILPLGRRRLKAEENGCSVCEGLTQGVLMRRGQGNEMVEASPRVSAWRAAKARPAARCLNGDHRSDESDHVLRSGPHPTPLVARLSASDC